MGHVLPNGGDVEVKGRDNTLCYDRIEFTDSGMVVCVNKQGYQMDCYPREEIQSVHTYTKHVEDAEWW